SRRSALRIRVRAAVGACDTRDTCRVPRCTHPAHRPNTPGRHKVAPRSVAPSRDRTASRLRGWGPQVLRDEVDLHRDLLQPLVDDERAVPRVVPVLLERLAQLAQAVPVYVDTSRGTARIVLTD